MRRRKSTCRAILVGCDIWLTTVGMGMLGCVTVNVRKVSAPSENIRSTDPRHGKADKMEGIRSEIHGLDHVALAVRDVERSAAWYQEVLGLERLHEDRFGTFPAIVGAGITWVALFPVKDTEPVAISGRKMVDMHHCALRVDESNFEKARADLTRRRISFEFQDHEIAHSIYFDDPDGHQIEITTYDLGSVATRDPSVDRTSPR